MGCLTLLFDTIDREDIVKSKYCLALCPILLLPIALFAYVQIPFLLLVILWDSLIIAMLLPALFSFTLRVGKILCALSIAAVLVLQQLLNTFYISTELDEEGNVEWDMSGFESTCGLIIIACILSAILVVVSFKLSKKQFNKKDF